MVAWESRALVCHPERSEGSGGRRTEMAIDVQRRPGFLAEFTPSEAEGLGMTIDR
jgi:hypothetical protein